MVIFAFFVYCDYIRLRRLKQAAIIVQSLENPIKVNSVQEACAKCFAVHILKFKSCKSHEKNERKNIKLLVFNFSPIDLAF